MTENDANQKAQLRQAYRAFIEDRTNQGWSQADIDEFAALVKDAMKTSDGTKAVYDFLFDQVRGVFLCGNTQQVTVIV